MSFVIGEWVNIAAMLSLWAGTVCMNAAGILQDPDSTDQFLALQTGEPGADGAGVIGQSVTDQADVGAADLPGKLQEHAKEISETLNQDQTIQEVSAGILEPIFSLAQYMSFDSFYWVAFALMVAGVVSFAGQLLFAKFFLLFKLSLNFKEILSDVLGLMISVVGLVLTTQAATQNSTFAENSVAVVSATAVGVVVGFIFYWWGQSLEFKAAKRVPKDAQTVS